MPLTPLLIQGGYTLTRPNCLCIAPDASRALLAHNAVSHRGVLLCAAGPTGEFTRVAFPEGWSAPQACSWSPMGGALGTATSDETCLLAVACGTRVGLCARMATLQACLKAQVPGPASDPAWYPTGLPYSRHWAVLPLDLGDGGGLQQRQAQQAHQQHSPTTQSLPKLHCLVLVPSPVPQPRGGALLSGPGNLTGYPVPGPSVLLQSQTVAP